MDLAYCISDSVISINRFIYSDKNNQDYCKLHQSADWQQKCTATQISYSYYRSTICCWQMLLCITATNRQQPRLQCVDVVDGRHIWVRGQESTMCNIAWISAAVTHFTVCQTPFHLICAAVTLSWPESIRQWPMASGKMETNKSGCGIIYKWGVDHHSWLQSSRHQHATGSLQSGFRDFSCGGGRREMPSYSGQWLSHKHLTLAAWFSGYDVGLWMADFPWSTPTCDHFVGKVSAMGQPTRPTQHPSLRGQEMSSNPRNYMDHRSGDHKRQMLAAHGRSS